MPGPDYAEDVSYPTLGEERSGGGLFDGVNELKINNKVVSEIVLQNGGILYKKEPDIPFTDIILGGDTSTFIGGTIMIQAELNIDYSLDDPRFFDIDFINMDTDEVIGTATTNEYGFATFLYSIPTGVPHQLYIAATSHGVTSQNPLIINISYPEFYYFGYWDERNGMLLSEAEYPDLDMAILPESADTVIEPLGTVVEEFDGMVAKVYIFDGSSLANQVRYMALWDPPDGYTPTISNEATFTIINNELSSYSDDAIVISGILALLVTPSSRSTSGLKTNDITNIYLTDDENNTKITHTAPHEVTYDSETEYTRIRIYGGNGNGTRYYAIIPFSFSGNFCIEVDFYTTGMNNDDFGIRICDKTALDTDGVWKSFGAWIITGQGRLVYGYGNHDTNKTMFLNNWYSSIKNNEHLRYTFCFLGDSVYYNIFDLDKNANVDGGTYKRTDDFGDLSGEYYLYIGGGKFTSGSNDKSVYIKNLTIEPL